MTMDRTVHARRNALSAFGYVDRLADRPAWNVHASKASCEREQRSPASGEESKIFL